MFDRLVIGVVGDNVNKPNMQPAEARMQVIRQLYADDSRIVVKPYHGLAMDFARQEEAQRRHYSKGMEDDHEPSD